jgi:hypothetical protein
MSSILDVVLPGEIFSGDPAELAHEYNQLALRYHPDMNRSPAAQDEFVKLQALYLAAQEQLKLNFWETVDSIRFDKYRARFRRKLDIPVGQMYVGDGYVIFRIDRIHKALWDNATQTIQAFRYATNEMQKEFSRYLPQIKTTIELPAHYIMVLEKTPDLLLLHDVPRTIPDWDRHVAWIVSSLHNIRCYLEFAGLTHNDISLDTCFVSPEFHSVALLGGWWYARPDSHKLLAVPTASYELFGPTMQTSRLADYSLDRELIRALTRELLGDRIGTKLTGTAPTALVDWARCTSSLNAIKEYEAWDKVLEASYGPKRFIPMSITADQIYGGT